MKHKHKAFTLIELLVVVLIIGILAAIAIAQYRMAVAKSQYASFKQLANSIKQAQDVYYMANGKYATKLNELDVSFPESNDARNTDKTIYYKNATCFITSTQSICNVKTTLGTIGYQVWFKDYPGLKTCVAFDTDFTSVSNKFCQNETHCPTSKAIKNTSEGFILWKYQ